MSTRRFRAARFAACCALVLLSLLSAALGAQAQQEPPQFRAAVNVVNIQVSVAAADGAFVDDLDASEFSLLVDGVPRELTAAYPINAREMEAPVVDAPVSTGSAVVTRTVGSRPAAARRHFLMYADLTTMTRSGLLNMRWMVSDFVENQLAPADMVGLAIYSPVRGLDYVVPFTTDHSLTMRALGELGIGRAGEAMAAAGAGLPMEDLIDSLGDDGVGFLGEMEGARTALEAEYSLRAVRELADTLGTIEGRKHLLMFSRGLPDAVVEDAGAREVLMGTADQAVDSSVAIYTFNTSNIPASTDNTAFTPTTSGSLLDNRQTSEFLAGETGGETWYFRGFVQEGLEEVERTTREFYVLAFRLLPGDPEMLDLDLSLSRPDVEVTWSPQRVRVPSTERTLNEAQQQFRVAEALQLGTEINEIDLDLLTVPVDYDATGSRLALVAEIPAEQMRNIVLDRGDGGLRLEILGMAVTPWGTVTDHFRSALSIAAGTLDPDGEIMPFRYYNLIAAPPGRHYVKFLLRETETGLMMSRATTFDVPESDSGELRARPPVLVLPPDRAAMVHGVEASDPPPYRAHLDLSYPFIVNGRELIPDQRRVLNPGHEGWFYVRVENVTRNPTNDEIGITIDGLLFTPDGMPIELAADDVVAAELETESDDLRLLVHFRLPDTIGSGAYSMAVDVRDHVVGERVQVSVPITVVEAQQ